MDISKVDNLTMFMGYVVAISPYLFLGIGCYFLYWLFKQVERKKAIERKKARRRARIAEEARLKIHMIHEMYEER